VQGILTAAQKLWPHIHISDSLVMADSAVKMAEAGCEYITVLGVDFMSENVCAILDQADFNKLRDQDKNAEHLQETVASSSPPPFLPPSPSPTSNTAELPAMLPSAIAAANSLFYCIDPRFPTRFHLVHTNPVLLGLHNPSPFRSVSTTSRYPSPIFRIHSSLHPVALTDSNDAAELVPSSAAAVAAAIRRASRSSPVVFTQRVEKQGKEGLVLPSPDFQRLCLEQLDLFRMVVDPDAVLSVSLVLLRELSHVVVLREPKLLSN
ncbi:hypothetical protein BHM03_00043737, partial [Ensete ventricosum]